MPPDPSYNTKVYVQQGGDRMVVASGGELDVESGGAFKIAGVAVTVGAAELNRIRTINLAAASQVLTALQSGQRFVGAVDAVFTLPSVVGAAGVWYEFECGALSAGTGLAVSPSALDHIRGNGLTSLDNKDLINTGATDRLGDAVRMYSDGVDGWVIEWVVGTWAKEA